MCGIAGYIGPMQVESVLLVALERLKYRGYDSAGMAIPDDSEIAIRKVKGVCVISKNNFPRSQYSASVALPLSRTDHQLR